MKALITLLMLLILSTAPCVARQGKTDIPKAKMIFTSLGNDMVHIEFSINRDRFLLLMKPIEHDAIRIEGTVYRDEEIFRLVPDDDFEELRLSLYDLLEWNDGNQDDVQVLDARTFIIKEDLSQIWICGILCRKNLDPPLLTERK